MKIIITGATGSLGGTLIRYYAGKGHDLLALGRWEKAPAGLLSLAEYINQDITKPFHLPKADLLIHAAAFSGDRGLMKDFILANEIGTRNVLEASKETPVFIHISSSSVYLPSNKPILENDAVLKNQLSHYGYSKLLSESVVQKNFKGEKCAIFRPRALYGPGDLQIIPRMLRLIKKNKLIKPGNMEIRISMTHYTNLLHAIDLFIENKSTGIHTYNVSDEKEYILIDVIRKLTDELYDRPMVEKKIPESVIRILGNLNLGGMTPLLVRSLTNDMVLDITKIKNELNYHPKSNFDNTLDETIDWIRSVGGPDVIKTQNKELIWT